MRAAIASEGRVQGHEEFASVIARKKDWREERRLDCSEGRGESAPPTLQLGLWRSIRAKSASCGHTKGLWMVCSADVRPIHEAIHEDIRHVVCSVRHFARECLSATHKHSRRRGIRSGALRMVTLHRAESQPGVHPSRSGFIQTRTRVGGCFGRYEL
eukprot:197438-Chlamydomonas_euryale.AAC.1